MTDIKNIVRQPLPRHASTLHRQLETHYGQIPFLLGVENAGHIQAENLVVTLRAIGGTLHDRFVYYPLFGPSAPQPRPHDPLRSIANHLDVRNLRQQVGRHEIEFAVGPDRGDTIELHCADFRQGRTLRFEGIATIDPHSGSPFKVQVEVTASNAHGVMDRSFELEYTSKSVALDELISLERPEYHIAIPMMRQVAEAFEAKNREWFEFGDSEEND